MDRRRVHLGTVVVALALVVVVSAAGYGIYRGFEEDRLDNQRDRKLEGEKGVDGDTWITQSGKSDLISASPIADTPTPSPTIAWETLSYDQKMTACHAMPNGSVYETHQAGRFFVRLPKDIYPFEDLEFVTVSGNATAGWVSNAGLPGQAFNSSPTCWSSYYELIGTGQMDIGVKSALESIPDYQVRFNLSDSGPPLPPEFYSR